MNFNPFKAVTTYPEMLDKIATIVFFVSVGLIALLRIQVPDVDKLLSIATIEIPIADISIPLGTFVPAISIAAFLRIIKFHNVLSDWFHIRQDFDINFILVPMSVKCDVRLSNSDLNELRKRRVEIMEKAFYHYATSTPGKAAIDSHYITLALDQWSWYWIVLEVGFIVLISSAFLFAFDKRDLAVLITLILLIVGTILLRSIRHNCIRYAQTEVELILEDFDRKSKIREILLALQSR